MDSSTLYSFEFSGHEEVTVDSDAAPIISIRIVEPDDADSGIVIHADADFIHSLAHTILEKLRTDDQTAGASD